MKINLTWLSAIAVGVFTVIEASAQIAPNAQWTQLLTAAKKEGALTLAGPPARTLRTALIDDFSKTFPEIKIDYIGGFPNELEPRILAERGAGRYLFDIYVNGAPSAIFTLKSAGALEPILPNLVLPEVRDEKKWIGGFKPGAGFADKSAPLTFFLFDGTASAIVHINSKMIGKGELKSFKDLLDPKWKGKIVMDDPRREGPGINALAILALGQGTDYVRALLAQQITFTRQPRQIAEWLARGQYPIGVGVGTGPLTDLRKEGVGKEVELFSGEHANNAFSMTPGWGGIALINRAPHPAAAKLYLNWLLSKEGQQAYVNPLETRNSRRVDVAPMDKELALRAGIQYVVSQTEEGMPLRLALKAIAERMYP
ncbi:MAG: extracellular solute-binding protein [Betaproteobacteria bacterium]|nr:extracellular solute-binding protein [Betaproteobacteria bacterium]